jgi:hypothetical protein
MRKATKRAKAMGREGNGDGSKSDGSSSSDSGSSANTDATPKGPGSGDDAPEGDAPHIDAPPAPLQNQSYVVAGLQIMLCHGAAAVSPVGPAITLFLAPPLVGRCSAPYQIITSVSDALRDFCLDGRLRGFGVAVAEVLDHSGKWLQDQTRTHV